jgi:hypothetical protein
LVFASTSGGVSESSIFGSAFASAPRAIAQIRRSRFAVITSSTGSSPCSTS